MNLRFTHSDLRSASLFLYSYGEFALELERIIFTLHGESAHHERFFAGGSSTVRGYDEREFGPGDFLLLANMELRYPLFWKLAGVCFLDMGNVWDSIDDVTKSDFDLFVASEEYGERRAGDVKYSVGVGLGIQTPVGPARVDYGLRLKRGMDAEGNKESVGRIHLTVGHAF